MRKAIILAALTTMVFAPPMARGQEDSCEVNYVVRLFFIISMLEPTPLKHLETEQILCISVPIAVVASITTTKEHDSMV